MYNKDDLIIDMDDNHQSNAEQESQKRRLHSGKDKTKTAAAGSQELIVYDQLQRYLAEVRAYPFLSKEEEINLITSYRKHKNIEAVTKLIVSNLRFVVSIAMRYKKTGIPLLDLIQEGNIGLMTAIKKFNPAKNTRLITYASLWIKSHILKYILNNWRLVKIGTTQIEKKLFFNLKKEQGKLTAQGIYDQQQFLLDRFNVNEKELIQMQNRLELSEISIEHEAQKNGYENAITLPASDANIDESLQKKELSLLFLEKLKVFESSLNERDRRILKKRLLTQKPQTLQILSEQMAISKERIRQLEVKIIKNLKKFMQNEIADFELLFQDVYNLEESE